MTKRPDSEGVTEKQSRIPDLRADYHHLTEKGLYMSDYVVKLENTRLSFSSLWKAVPYQAGDAPNFKASFIIEKGGKNDKAVEAVIKELAKEKFGKNWEKTLASIRNNPNRFCYQDGDTKKYDGYDDTVMGLSAKAKEGKPPLVFDRNKTVLREKDGKPYDGCYVNASIELFAYDKPSQGISASLRWVQFSKDGDAFSGSTPVDVDNEVEDLGDGSDADDIA